MKFILSRTSAWYEKRPCDEAHELPPDEQGDRRWGIDLEWNQLPEFIEKHGKVVVGRDKSADAIPGYDYWLEIYDHYRE